MVPVVVDNNFDESEFYTNTETNDCVNDYKLGGDFTKLEPYNGSVNKYRHEEIYDKVYDKDYNPEEKEDIIVDGAVKVSKDDYDYEDYLQVNEVRDYFLLANTTTNDLPPVAWTTEDPTVAQIIQSRKIWGVADGTTYVIGYSEDNKIQKKIKITVGAGPKPTNPADTEIHV